MPGSFSPKLGTDLESGPNSLAMAISGGSGLVPVVSTTCNSPRSSHMSPTLLPAAALNTAVAPASPAAVDHYIPAKMLQPGTATPILNGSTQKPDPLLASDCSSIHSGEIIYQC